MDDTIKALADAARQIVYGFDCDDLTMDGRKDMDRLISALAAYDAAQATTANEEEIEVWDKAMNYCNNKGAAPAEIDRLRREAVRLMRRGRK